MNKIFIVDIRRKQAEHGPWTKQDHERGKGEGRAREEPSTQTG